MADQPAYRPLQASAFFPDGRSARPIESGTVPRGADLLPEVVRTGRVDASSGANYARASFVAHVPIDVTPELLARGRERFDIFCAVCHDRLGTGDGKIVQRGFTRPPSYHTDLSRGFKLRGEDVPLTEVPDGYLFEVITNGFGAMPDHAAQVPVRDRWAITAYIRALQKSVRPAEGQK